jgi:hypothetical protein
MFVKKLVLGAAAAAMPLTALAAAPASASQGDYRHHDNPYVYVTAYDDYVNVKYKCYSDDYKDDDYGNHGRRHYQSGTLTVHYRNYDNWYWVRCDGYEHWKNFDVYGHGKFRAVIKDGNGNRDYDYAYVDNDDDDDHDGGHHY